MLRRTTTLRLALTVGLSLCASAALAGCGDDSSDASSSSSSSATSSATSTDTASSTATATATSTATSTSTDTAEVADPCEAISAADVAALIGVDEVESATDGADAYKGCSYTDTSTDTVLLTTTVWASSADFEDVWDSAVGDIEADWSEIDVTGADAARLITATDDDALALTAVAASNGVIDIANLQVDAPYDIDTQTTTMTTVLAALVAQNG